MEGWGGSGEGGRYITSSKRFKRFSYNRTPPRSPSSLLFKDVKSCIFFPPLEKSVHIRPSVLANLIDLIPAFLQGHFRPQILGSGVQSGAAARGPLGVVPGIHSALLLGSFGQKY